LVAIAASRYSVQVRYVGQTVEVRETATHYMICVGETCIAQHAKAGRHAVVHGAGALSWLAAARGAAARHACAAVGSRV
jgi:Mu transposase-like protein